MLGSSLGSSPALIFSFLGDIAGPIARAAGSKSPEKSAKKMGKALSSGSGGEAERPPEALPSNEPLVAEVLATAQIRRMVASPPKVQRDAAGGLVWHCEDDTELYLVTPDVESRAFRYGAGTSIPVSQGLIHLPPV